MRSGAGRWLRSVRYLRPVQVLGQLGRPFRGTPRPRRAGGSRPALALEPVAAPFLGPARHARESTARAVTLLNRRVGLGTPPDWDFSGAGPLFAFHLHYHDWLRAPGLTPDERAALLLDWVRRQRAGTGWHPATISARAFAWAKLLLSPGLLPGDAALERELAASLADQLATLAGRLERDLLANHLLFNLLALVLGGMLLRGSEAERWLAFEDALCRELAEQILPDGAHFERSPMYHALVLEGLLDVLNVAAGAPGRLSAEATSRLRDAAGRMLGALAVWTHPDGEIALFGDSAFAIAPAPADLAGYAAQLRVARLDPRLPGLLDAAGFVRLGAGPFTLIASVAGPMPAYQPGHAHCDALAFELSVAGERLVTDTGVFEYVPGPRRAASRATHSHATIEVDGEEQAELWGAHRVGGRPRVALEGFEAGRRAEASCRGWSRPGVEVRRAFEVAADGVRLVDRVAGATRRVRLALPLAPGVAARLDGERALLSLSGGRTFGLELPAGPRWRIEPAPYYPEFGRECERLALVGEAARLEHGVWRLSLAP